jgi:hypothetical protein
MRLPNYYEIIAAQNSQFPISVQLQNDDGTLMDITGKTFEFVVRTKIDNESTTPLIRVGQTPNAQGYITVNTTTSTVQVVVYATANTSAGGYYTLWMDPNLSDQTALVQGPYNIQPTVLV